MRRGERHHGIYSQVSFLLDYDVTESSAQWYDRVPLSKVMSSIRLSYYTAIALTRLGIYFLQFSQRSGLGMKMSIPLLLALGYLSIPCWFPMPYKKFIH